MPYCMDCGGSLLEQVPPGDDRTRLVCPRCGKISYINPKIVVGTLPVVEGRVLLLRRGIEPCYGKWSYAGGFLEMNETAEEGARRETREELGIGVDGLHLLGVYSRPPAGIVTVVYLADQIQGEPGPTSEALEGRFFTPEEIPWEDLAFPTTVSALRDWTSTVR